MAAIHPPTTSARRGPIGRPLDRSEGRLKVTGSARYTGDVHLPNMAYASLIDATVACGRITGIDTQAALRAPGVIEVVTYRNALKLHPPKTGSGAGPGPGEAHLALQSGTVHYNGEPVGVVIAESSEQADYASTLVAFQYQKERPYLAMEATEAPSTQPKERFGTPMQGSRGDPAAFATGVVQIDATYETPVEFHNPMEPHATVASWHGDELTIYETTQYINGVQQTLASCFGIAPAQVTVFSYFVGGGFGSKGSTWQHTAIAAMAARQVGRPVRLVLTRPFMFNSVGHRSRTIQRVALSADRNGKLIAVRHEVESHTSPLQDFIESSSILTRVLYAIPNLTVSHRLVHLNLATSTFMRAPGETSGSFALESAMDELAVKAGVDPIALRLANHTDVDPDSGKPFSSKHLRECYARGAEVFGWSRRQPAPRSMRRGDQLVGWGMASAIYPGNRQAASAKMRIARDGSVTAASATHEIGQGTYTAMTQIAAESLGVPVEKVRFELGSSLLPKAPVAGGSMTAASVGPAVAAAARALQRKLLEVGARTPGSPLYGATWEDVIGTAGKLVLRDDLERGVTYDEILRRGGLDALEAEATTQVAVRGATPEHCRSNQPNDTSCYAFQSFGAQFAEVEVDPLTLVVRVTRFVGVFDVGRILNEKMARSQGLGGIIMGIGMALMEDGVHDPHWGRVVTRNLADYHVPVQADVPAIEVLFTDVPDVHFNEIGCRGVGEIPIVGAAAAVANAVYHATGKRLRELPITPDRLLT